MSNWPKRFAAFKKGMKPYFGKIMSNKDIADIIGNTEDSIQVVTSKEHLFPRWAKLAVWVFEEMKRKIDTEYRPYDFKASDIYTGTAPPIKYDPDLVMEAIKNFKPQCKCSGVFIDEICDKCGASKHA